VGEFEAVFADFFSFPVNENKIFPVAGNRMPVKEGKDFPEFRFN
jgi:hypothetical protein